MITNKYLLIAVVIQLVSRLCFGQLQNKVNQDKDVKHNLTVLQETLYLHTNDSFLLVGESLLFKAYCINTQNQLLSPVSSIAYIEVIDSNSKTVLSTKIALNNGCGSGDLFLPSTLISGNYTLIAYTNWMKNYSIDYFFKTQLTIINPFKRPIEESNTSIHNALLNNTAELKISKPTSINNDTVREVTKRFKTRSLAKAQLIVNDTSVSHVSVSVRKVENLSLHSPTINNFLALTKSINNPTKYSNENTKSILYIPELRGNLISGKVVKGESNKPVVGELVFFSIPSKAYSFMVSQTDSLGTFYFNRLEGNYSNSALFSVNKISCSDCKIKIDSSGLSNYDRFKPKSLTVDVSIKKLIEERSLWVQLENAYYAVKQDSILDRSPYTRFYGKPDKVYRLDDFVRFPTMKDILIEYVLEIIVKKKNNSYDIKVMDFVKRKAFINDPLILIDGIPIFDFDEVMNYDPLLIESVEIVGRRYFYGGLVCDGIISFSTYEGTGQNLQLPKKEKQLSAQPKKLYYSPNYSSGERSLEKIPDYRTQLYWNPHLVLSKSTEIEFFTSDVLGFFELVVEGITTKGKPIYQRELISVESN